MKTSPAIRASRIAGLVARGGAGRRKGTSLTRRSRVIPYEHGVRHARGREGVDGCRRERGNRRSRGRCRPGGRPRNAGASWLPRADLQAEIAALAPSRGPARTEERAWPRGAPRSRSASQPAMGCSLATSARRRAGRPQARCGVRPPSSRPSPGVVLAVNTVSSDGARRGSPFGARSRRVHVCGGYRPSSRGATPAKESTASVGSSAVQHPPPRAEQSTCMTRVSSSLKEHLSQ